MFCFVVLLLTVAACNNCYVAANVPIKPTFFTEYPTYGTIMTYLTTLANAYPNRVKLTSIGHSVEHRQIPAITITSDQFNVRNNPIIMIAAGMYSDGWPSNLVAVYLIQQLVQQYKVNGFILEGVDWIIFPVLNPDGYEYSHTTNRHWFNNRKPYGGNCIGANLGRNFDIDWHSEIACSNETNYFTGSGPFSEPETKAFRDFVMKYKGRIQLFIDVAPETDNVPHILYPWSYTGQQLPTESLNEHKRLVETVSEAIRAISGTVYEVDQVYYTTSTGSGRATDWMKKNIDVPFSFTLRTNSTSKKFIPPTSEILPIVKETFEVFKAFHKYLFLDKKNNCCGSCNRN